MNMSIDTIRRLYQIGTIVAIVLFVAMILDAFLWGSALLIPLAVIFALVAIFMVVLLFVTPLESYLDDDTEETTTDGLVDYPGDVHEVVDLEGIGPTYAKRLQGAGIHHTQELLFTDDAKLQKVAQVPAKTVANWKSMAQLIKVKGVGPQYAEALTRGGVDGIEGLKDCDPTTTAAAVTAYLETLENTVVGQTVSEKRVATWKRNASKMRKVPIDMDKLTVRNLESKQARTDATSTA